MTDKTNKQFQDSIVNNSRTGLFQAAQMAKGYFYEGQQYEGNEQYHNRSAKKQEASDFSDVRQNAEVIEPVKTTRRRTKNLPKEQTKVVQSENVQQEKPQHSQTQNQNGKGVRGRRKPKARRTRLDMEKEIQTLDDDELKEQDQILLSRENKEELIDDKDDAKNKKYHEVMLQNQAETQQPQEQIHSPLSKNKKRLPSSKASSNQQIVFQPSSPHSEPEQQLYQQQDDTSSPNTSSPQRQPTGLFEESPKKSSSRSQPKEMTPQQKSIHLLKILTFPIKQNMVMKTNLIRVDGSLFGLHPQFHIYFQGDKTYLMSAKKVSRTPYSTFVISTDPKNYEENSAFYLGKAKCSVIGDQLDLYGPGFSPKDAYEKHKKPRQLLATVVYQTRILSSGQPRDFKVYIKNPQVDYYEDFPQVHMYQPQIPLHLLYQNPHNRQKITVLQNRKPNYQQDIKGYSLNFKGRVGMASVKNFILEKAKQQVELQNDPQKNEVLDEIVIFGKANEKKYNMDVKLPLSPFVAFGIVLSSFDEKYFCE